MSEGRLRDENIQEKISSQIIQKRELLQEVGRTSARFMDSGMLIQQKAEKRRTQKYYQGINHNPFTILQKVSNKYLAKIVVHYKTDLGANEGSIDGIIEILKAKELAQAEILFLVAVWPLGW